MRLLTRFLCLALVAGVLSATASTVLAQAASADEDQAKAMLNTGLTLYSKLDFKGAQAALLKVDRTGLSDAEKKTLADYLTRIPGAFRKQSAARQALADAQDALKANNLVEARVGFMAAAASDLLPAAERDEAKRQLALVDERMKAAAAAEEKPAAPAPKPVIAPAPIPVVAPAPKPVVAPAPKPVPSSEPPPRSVTPEPVKPDEIASAPPPKLAPPPPPPKLAPPPPAPKTPPTPPVDAKAQARMQALLEDARKALAANDGLKAIEYLQEVQAMEPTGPLGDQARILMVRAREVAASQGSGTLISRYERRMAVAKEAAVVDFEKAMTRSKEVLARAKSPEDFDAAAGDARTARNILETNKSLFTADEFRDRLTLGENQLKWIEEQRQAWNRQEVRVKAEAMSKAEADRRQKERVTKIQRVQSLTHRAKALRQQHQYAEAVQVLGQILELEPDNNWAAEWKQYLEAETFLRSERDILKQRQDQTQYALLDVREAEIPWWEILRYPRDWKEMTARREGAGAAASAETEEDRLVRQRLQQRIAKVDFSDIEFKDVIAFLKDVTSLNIQVKWNALQVAGIDKTTAVNVQLTDVTAEKALRVILDDLGSGGTPLSFVVEDGVITVSTKEDLSRRTFVRVYDIRDMIIRVPNFRGPRIELSQVGQGTGQQQGGGGGFFEEGAAGGTTGTGRGADERLEDELKTRAQLIQDIVTLITETIAPTTWRTAGGEIGAIRELHGQLVVTQTAENHRALLDLINQLREARALQIAIEARFIVVNTGFLNRIGIDLDFYFNLGSQLGGVGGPTGPRVRDPFTGDLVDAQLSNGPWGGKPFNKRFTPIGVRQDSRSFLSGMNTGVDPDIGTSVTTSAIGLAGTFLDDIQVDFLIEATQAHQTARTLTAPRITLFNGQRAYITVATQTAYVANYEPVVAENASALRPIIGYVPTGTVLDVEATVSADRRYVTMTVRPQVAELIPPLAEITFSTIGGGGGTLTEATIQLPTVTVQDLQTTVSVPDGGTLLLGGQKAVGEVEHEMGAPLLNKVPILNRLFTNRAKVRDESTLLILIKPKIIIQTEEEAKAFP